MARKKHSGIEQFKVRLGAVVCSDSFLLCDCGVLWEVTCTLSHSAFGFNFIVL